MLLSSIIDSMTSRTSTSDSEVHLEYSEPMMEPEYGHQFNWLFKEERLRKTPTVKMGISHAQELIFRQKQAMLMQAIGQKSGLTQLAINTSVIFMHRFYMYRTIKFFPRIHVAIGFVFAAGKVEESARKLEHLIRYTVEILRNNKNGEFLDKRDKLTYEMDCEWREKIETLCQNNCDISSVAYEEMRKTVLECETEIYAVIGFQLQITHPHKFVIRMSGQLGAANRPPMYLNGTPGMNGLQNGSASADGKGHSHNTNISSDNNNDNDENDRNKDNGGSKLDTYPNQSFDSVDIVEATTKKSCENKIAAISTGNESIGVGHNLMTSRHIARDVYIAENIKDISQYAYNLATVSSQLTMLNLKYKPETIATTCLNIASKAHSVKFMPMKDSTMNWYQVCDPNTDFKEIEAVSEEFLNLIKACQLLPSWMTNLARGSSRFAPPQPARANSRSQPGHPHRPIPPSSSRPPPPAGSSQQQSASSTGSTATSLPSASTTDASAQSASLSQSISRSDGGSSSAAITSTTSSSSHPSVPPTSSSSHHPQHHRHQQQPSQLAPGASSSNRPPSSSSSQPGTNRHHPPHHQQQQMHHQRSHPSSSSRSSANMPHKPQQPPPNQASSGNRQPQPPSSSSRLPPGSHPSQQNPASSLSSSRPDHPRRSDPATQLDNNSRRSYPDPNHPHPHSHRSQQQGAQPYSHLTDDVARNTPPAPLSSSASKPLSPHTPPEPYPGNLTNDTTDFLASPSDTNGGGSSSQQSAAALSAAQGPKLSLSSYRERLSTRTARPTGHSNSSQNDSLNTDDSGIHTAASEENCSSLDTNTLSVDSPINTQTTNHSNVSTPDLAPSFNVPQDSPTNPRLKLKVKRESSLAAGGPGTSSAPAQGDRQQSQQIQQQQHGHSVKYADSGLKIKIKPPKLEMMKEGESAGVSRSGTPIEDGEVFDSPSSTGSSDRRSDGSLKMRLTIPKRGEGDMNGSGDAVDGGSGSGSHRSHHHSGHHHRKHSHHHKSKKHKQSSRYESKSSKRSAEYYEDRPSKSSRMEYDSQSQQQSSQSALYRGGSSTSSSSMALNNQNSGFSIDNAFSSTMPANIFDDEDDSNQPPITPTADMHHHRLYQRQSSSSRKPPSSNSLVEDNSIPPHHQHFHQLMAQHRANEANKPPLPPLPASNQPPPPPPPPPPHSPPPTF